MSAVRVNQEIMDESNTSTHSSLCTNGKNNRTNDIPINTQNNRNRYRYSGQKRSNPEPSDDSSDNEQSTDDDEDSDDSEYQQTTNSSNNNKRRNNLIKSSSPSQSNAPKRRKLSYVTNNMDKWKQKQSATQRRSTRMQYRKLADETHDDRAEIVDPMTNNFIDKLVQQNDIYKDVCHPNEAFMDIEQTKNMSNVLKEQTRNLANEQFTITPNDYINSIYREFGKNDNQEEDNEPAAIDWSAIGDRFAQWFLTLLPIQFMSGALEQSGDVQDIPKKSRQVRQKKSIKSFTATSPKIEPTKVSKQNVSDKTETKSRVSHLTKVLRKMCGQKDGVNPFEFLVNPDSYSQTIENLFDLSFVMKEGFAQMDVSSSTEQPVLSYVSSSERTRRRYINESTQSNVTTNGQCIIKFNPQTFCSLINVYDINESQIQRADKTEDDE